MDIYADRFLELIGSPESLQKFSYYNCLFMVVIDSVYSFDIPIMLGKLGHTHVWWTESSLNKCFFLVRNTF